MDRSEIRELVQKHLDRAHYLASIGKVELAGVESSDELNTIMADMSPSDQSAFMQRYAEIQDEILDNPTPDEIEARAIEDPNNFWLKDATIAELVRRHNAIRNLADQANDPSKQQAAAALINAELMVGVDQVEVGSRQLFWDLYAKHNNHLSHDELTNPGKPKPLTGIGEYWSDRLNVRALAKRHAYSNRVFLAAAAGNRSDEQYKTSVSNNAKDIRTIERSLNQAEKTRFGELYKYEREVADAEEVVEQQKDDAEIERQVKREHQKQLEMNQLFGVVIPIIVTILIFMWLTGRL